MHGKCRRKFEFDNVWDASWQPRGRSQIGPEMVESTVKILQKLLRIYKDAAPLPVSEGSLSFTSLESEIKGKWSPLRAMLYPHLFHSCCCDRTFETGLLAECLNKWSSWSLSKFSQARVGEKKLPTRNGEWAPGAGCTISTTSSVTGNVRPWTEPMCQMVMVTGAYELASGYGA
jgi:hypothetical protein